MFKFEINQEANNGNMTDISGFILLCDCVLYFQYSQCSQYCTCIWSFFFFFFWIQQQMTAWIYLLDFPVGSMNVISQLSKHLLLLTLKDSLL